MTRQWQKGESAKQRLDKALGKEQQLSKYARQKAHQARMVGNAPLISYTASQARCLAFIKH